MKFWSVKNGQLRISLAALLKFIEKQGYVALKPSYADNRIVCKLTGKVLKRSSIDDVKRECLEYIKAEKSLSDNERENLIADFVRVARDINRNSLYQFPTADLIIPTDTRDEARIYFKNGFVVITKDNVEFKSIDELTGIIFEDQLINHDLKLMASVLGSTMCDFMFFLWNITGGSDETESELKYDSLLSIIGYLIHTYKDPSNSRAIILSEEDYSSEPNGGTGKGIICRAISKVRPVVFEDGKRFSISSGFCFSQVKHETNVVVIDDLPANFSLEKFFSSITEGLVVEKKHENKYTIPSDLSPKLCFTTNFSVLGEGTSFERRVFEFYLTPYYDLERTPIVEFGRLFFEGWNYEEWNNFYHVMIDAVQTYLRHGLIKPPYFNKYKKALMQTTSEDFREFVEGNLEYNKSYEKTEVYAEFFLQYKNHEKIQKKTFTAWMRLYAQANGLQFDESHSGNRNFFQFRGNQK